ncbi:MAG: GDP-mannose 4,6-dehydratase, partial [Conexivisphaera sp.]
MWPPLPGSSGTLRSAPVRTYSPTSAGRTRIYYATSSEMFGRPDPCPQNEDTPMRPRSPYAVSKLAGYWTSRVYREAYDMFVACGILFNHESEVRGPEFVT